MPSLTTKRANVHKTDQTTFPVHGKVRMEECVQTIGIGSPSFQCAPLQDLERFYRRCVAVWLKKAVELLKYSGTQDPGGF